MPEDQANPRQHAPDWFEDGLSFSCTQCGNCCTGPEGYVWYTQAEGQAMQEYLGLDQATFEARYTKRVFGRRSLSETIRDGQHDCVFLTWDERGKAGCSIYPVRPTQCRTWPFWPSNLRGRRAWARASQGCPGMDSGKLIPADQIRILASKVDP